MDKSKRLPLSIMFLLQYAVWGIWVPVLGRYLEASPAAGGLGFTGKQLGMILGLAGSCGALASPFIAGQLADRYFSTERCLAALLAIGGVINWVMAYQTSFSVWLVLSIAYSIVYMPTLALTNSLAFVHLKDPKREFPLVRNWGSVGWILAGWMLSIFWLQSNLGFKPFPPFIGGPDAADATHRLGDSLRFSGMLSIAYAGFCLFFLPHTPPKRDAVQKLAFAKAFTLFRRPSFALLVLASLPISMIHQIYLMKTGQFLVAIGLKNSLIPQVLSIGQFSQLAVMVGLGLMITRLGFRWVIVAGCLAYAARYLVFGLPGVSLPAVIAVQLLHGVCYACFFIGAFIYVDRLAPDDIRHSTQTVFGMIILGGGPVAGGYLLGKLQELFTPAGGTVNYSHLWLTLAAIALATAALIVLFFKDESSKAE